MSMLSKQLEELKWFRDILKNGGKVPSFMNHSGRLLNMLLTRLKHCMQRFKQVILIMVGLSVKIDFHK